jgi:transcriptional regulator of arginine metabolism
MTRRPPKLQRQSVLLEILRDEKIPSQEVLRERLAGRGVEVAQATLSRDLRELGVVKMPDDAGSAYVVPADVTDPTPTLTRLLPTLFLGAEGVDRLVVVKTLTGGAQPIAVAIDWEEWSEVLGTIAGDDTILLILRRVADRERVIRRLEKLAGL